jgi:catechol 2,3-dioxygenase-like lactoylglutathione lyase family enzyme
VPAITDIDHIAITVNDLDATCTFYRRLFDARVLIEYESDGRIALRQIGLGTAVLSIHQAGNGVTLVAARPTIGAADICLRWDGTVNDALTLLASQDIAVVEGPVSRCTADGTASQSVYFRDPDGNLVELMSTNQ